MIMKSKRTIISWSGGKDSCLALNRAKASGFDIIALITAIDETSEVSKSNGVSKEILCKQAEALGVELISFSTNWADYEEKLILNLTQTREKYQISCCIFGDIDIARHREFEEKVSSIAGLEAILPLWEEKRDKLVHEVINSGIKAKISVIRNDLLPESFLAVDYDDRFLSDISRFNGVDICGENGEFHTLVYDSPSFRHPIKLKTSLTGKNGNYSFCNFRAI